MKLTAANFGKGIWTKVELVYASLTYKVYINVLLVNVLS